MALLINLRELEDQDLDLQGQATPAELQLESLDEVIHLAHPLVYRLQAEKLEKSVLVRGSLEMVLDCECVRCLKPCRYTIRIDDWVCHLQLEGEEKAPVTKECLDLTPYLREDILLAFPQNPLCEPDCGGLISPQQKPETGPGGLNESTATSSAWAELNKLKFDK